jgi:alpha-tubulin suppressor-like RCC1 family protein
MSYTGIGATDPNHPLEVEGQVFISNVEAGSASQDVPFEVYSDYTGNSGLTDSRQLRLRVTPSATTTTSVHVDMGVNNTDGDYFFISEPVTGATTVGTKSTFTINQAGNVGVGSNLSVTGNVVTSNIVGGSPLTISTGSNVQILTSNVGIGTVPLSNTRVHIQGGSTASITNANVFPNFIFSRNANASLNHGGGSYNAARHVAFPSEDGKVWTTGSGYDGCLGLGDTVSRNKFTLMSTLDGVANIVATSTSGYSASSTWETTALLDDTGNVWMCGANEWGMCGLNDTYDRWIPTLVSNSNIYNVSITEVATGTAGALLLDSTGQMWGAGYNVDSRLGQLSGAGTGTTYPTFIPTYPGAQGEYSFSSIARGESHSLALQDNGRIWSTGTNTNGRTGRGTATGITAGWMTVDNTDGINDVSITQISSGELHSMARDSTGNVWMTGHNNWGELGLGDTVDKWHFIKVTTNVNVASGVTALKIAAGVSRSYVLDTNGRMWGAGYNTNGNFGQPPYVNTINTFIRADAGPIADKSITDFALTSYVSVIVRTSDNEYWVTGWGGGWTLGTGNGQDQFAYTKILDVNANPPPDYGYTRSLLLENTETGKGPSIELKNKNAVSSRIQMEDGTSGKLNIGFVDASFDSKLSGGDGALLEPWQERAQSNTMTRGVTINQAGGTMVAGGSTSNIGLNKPFFNSSLPGLDNYGLYAGTERSTSQVILTKSGKLYGWGKNAYGELGLGDTTARTQIVEIQPPTVNRIVGVANGGEFTVLIDYAGTTYASGRNNYGQLNKGDTTDRSTFSQTSTVNGMLSTGEEHHVLWDYNTNTVWTGGRGTEGQLGHGNYNNLLSIAVISGGNITWSGNVRNIFCARQSTYLITDHATANLWATGLNTYGVLGVGDASNKNQFTQCTGYTGTPKMIGCGFAATYLVTTAGKLYSCGHYGNGRLGILPVPVADVTSFTACTGDVNNVTIIQVVGTSDSGCALDSNGDVWVVGEGTERGVGQDKPQYNEFTKVTIEPFASATITQIGCAKITYYAIDTEGNFWVASDNNNDEYTVPGYIGRVPTWSKTNIYDVVPKEFKYTPTLTLENPNPDYGATVEFKNPNNRAFVNLDDKTSTLRLGFVKNEDDAGQFRGISIAPTGGLTNVPLAIITNNATSIGTSGTKIFFKNVVVDNYGFFDVANNDYIPKIPGYYFVTVTGLYIAQTSVPYLITYIRVNGSNVAQYTSAAYSSAYPYAHNNTVVYLDGKTQYVEVYCSTDTTRIVAAGARLCIHFLTAA